MVYPTLGEKRRKKRCINIGRENSGRIESRSEGKDLGSEE